ncbi:hypothetical protein BJY52DRAFT_1353128 [Lactarius psammicola]|nr:hypothetical protein BJY52DRAFT_1353128 [Lactarius psammicola]
MKVRVLRTVRYALPEVLHAHVQTVQVAPTTYFGSPRMLQQTLRKRSGGAILGELMKVLSSWAIDPDPVTPLIAGYHGDYPGHDNLMAFMKEYRTDAPYATYTFGQIGGVDLPNEPSQEANVNLLL